MNKLPEWSTYRPEYKEEYWNTIDRAVEIPMETMCKGIDSIVSYIEPKLSVLKTGSAVVFRFIVSFIIIMFTFVVYHPIMFTAEVVGLIYDKVAEYFNHKFYELKYYISKIKAKIKELNNVK